MASASSRGRVGRSTTPISASRPARSLACCEVCTDTRRWDGVLRKWRSSRRNLASSFVRLSRRTADYLPLFANWHRAENGMVGQREGVLLEVVDFTGIIKEDEGDSVTRHTVVLLPAMGLPDFDLQPAMAITVSLVGLAWPVSRLTLRPWRTPAMPPPLRTSINFSTSVRRRRSLRSGAPLFQPTRRAMFARLFPRRSWRCYLNILTCQCSRTVTDSRSGRARGTRRQRHGLA